MAKAAPKRKAANGYKFAEPLPKGEILEDVAKKKWKLGPSIGKGGFGEIYSAQEAGSGGSKYPYVIKIEPHANGPLFVEMHFYMRNAKPEDVDAFKKQKGLKTFGMPVYLGSGSHEYNGEKYRFIVMEKFGTDLWKIFLEHDRTFPATTVFKLATQILDVLQYIHERGYVHADIKAANILMGTTKDTVNKQIYLVDFGLATKYNGDTDFKPNPKKAHDGTIEYLSRDAHKGVQTRRGDLEILAYNIIQWLGCALPWEHKLKDPNTVHNLKEEHMASVPKFIKACFEKRSPPGPVVDFLNYILTLEHDSVPDYKTIRKIFVSGLDAKDSLGKPFQFSSISKTPTKRKAEVKKAPTPKRKAGRRKIEQPSEDEKENVEDDENDQHDEPMPMEKEEVNPTSDNEESTSLSTRRRGRAVVNYNENSDDERKKVTKKKQTKKATKSTKEVHVTGDNMDGFTDAMKDVLKRKQQNGKSKGNKKKAAPVEERGDDDEDDDSTMDGYTESMKEIQMKKKTKLETKSDDDSMDGYTESMKEIQMKKKTKLETKSDDDSMDGYTESMKEIQMKKKTKSATKSGDDSTMDGFTESMKEIAMKKKTKPATKSDDDSTMDGFTESMKEIAKKKKTKPAIISRKKPDLEPVATSSKAQDKKGLTRPKRNRKVTPEPTHTDSSGHESDSE